MISALFGQEHLGPENIVGPGYNPELPWDLEALRALRRGVPLGKGFIPARNQ
jgi:hypothetical protein